MRLGSLLGRRVSAVAAAGGYGPNLVENGTFTADDTTGWTLVRCSVASEKLNAVNATGIAGSATYLVPAGLEDGASYLVEFTVSSYVAHPAINTVALGGGDAISYTPADGPFALTVVAGASNENLRITVNNNANFLIDDITCRKIL